MIKLDSVPCCECEHFRGVYWLDMTERSEYIKCDVAEKSIAKNLYKEINNRILCDKFKEATE